MLAASDLSTVPPEFIKSFFIVLGWLITTGAAFWGGSKIANKGSKDSPVNIAQPLDVRKYDDAARRSELVRIESTLKQFGDRVDGLAEQINAQFAAMTRAGQDRAAAITQSIDEEVRSLSTRIGTLADALHEKINKASTDNARQSAEIESLKVSSFRHDAEVSRIQEHIAALIARPVCNHRKAA